VNRFLIVFLIVAVLSAQEPAAPTTPQPCWSCLEDGQPCRGENDHESD